MLMVPALANLASTEQNLVCIHLTFQEAKSKMQVLGIVLMAFSFGIYSNAANVHLMAFQK